jgi:hypothetical protein
MEFRIADVFVDSLSKLGNEDQKAVKTTVFDLQVNPSSSGMNFHKLDRAQDSNFASVRVSHNIPYRAKTSSDRKGGKPTTVEPKDGFQKR